jgi:pyruvate formate lyase activating enzyme
MAQQTAPLVDLEAKSPFELRLNHSKSMPETAIRDAIARGDVGFLHSFTTGSCVDGPGVRVVAWTAGCMWRCMYCHNPDTWSTRNGIPVTIEKATEELRKYRRGLNVMSGGLTLSGGEPLMQHRFAVKLLTAAKQMGVHTCIETNGYFGDRLSDAEIEKIDLVMLGIKTWGAERHRQLTGMDLEPTLTFARRLAHRNRPIWVRFVLVPGLTDDPQIILQIAHFASELGNVERVDVLPFHQMGRYKWAELGMDYKLRDTEMPAPESVESACEQFRSFGLKAY